MAREADERGQPCSSSCPDRPWSLVRRPINTQDHKREIRSPIYKELSHHSGCPGRHEVNRHKNSLESSSSNYHCFLKKEATPCPRDPRGHVLLSGHSHLKCPLPPQQGNSHSFLFLSTLGTEPRALHTLGKYLLIKGTF